MSCFSNENFPATNEGFNKLLDYLEENPSVEGYLYLFNNFQLDDTLRSIVSEQIEEACLLSTVEDLFEVDEDTLELYLYVNFPPTHLGAHEMCNFIRDFQSDFAWDFFEDHHIKFLTAYEKQQMYDYKNKIFDLNMFNHSMLNLVTSMYLEEVDPEKQVAFHAIPIDYIIDHIANRFKASGVDIISKRRDSIFVRAACIYILCDLHEYTTEEIAEAFDISVDRVQEIVKQVHEFYNVSIDFKNRIDRLMEEIDEFFDVV